MMAQFKLNENNEGKTKTLKFDFDPFLYQSHHRKYIQTMLKTSFPDSISSLSFSL